MCYNLSKYIVYPSIASQLFGCIHMNRDVIIASRNPEMEDNGRVAPSSVNEQASDTHMYM